MIAFTEIWLCAAYNVVTYPSVTDRPVLSSGIHKQKMYTQWVSPSDIITTTFYYDYRSYLLLLTTTSNHSLLFSFRKLLWWWWRHFLELSAQTLVITAFYIYAYLIFRESLKPLPQHKPFLCIDRVFSSRHSNGTGDMMMMPLWALDIDWTLPELGTELCFKKRWAQTKGVLPQNFSVG